jgi:hypothetical protein
MELKGNEAVEYLDPGAASFMGLMNELVEIKGYRAAAIMSYDGELLYSNSKAAGVNNYNLSAMFEVYNGLFGDACGLSEKSGFVACTEVALRTGEEVMVIRCSGKDCLVGVRLFVLIEEQGNVAITQRRLGNLLPRLMRCLTWEPDNLVPLYMREAAWRQKSAQIEQDGKTVSVN